MCENRKSDIKPISCQLTAAEAALAVGGATHHVQAGSDIKSRDSVLSQDSLETHFGCLSLVDWCLGLGLDVVVLSIS